MEVQTKSKKQTYIILGAIAVVIIFTVAFAYLKSVSVNSELKKNGKDVYNSLSFMYNEKYSDISDYTDGKNVKQVDDFIRKYGFDENTDKLNQKEKEIYWSLSYMNSDLYTIVKYKYDKQYNFYTKSDYENAKKDFNKMKKIAKEKLGL